MKRFTFMTALVLVVVCCLAAPWRSAQPVASAQEKLDKAEAAKKELAALQGTWKMVAYEEDGKEVPAEDRLYIIDKDKMTFKQNGEVAAEGTLELDATRTPKHLDYRITSGQTDLIIYTRVGDYLIQCGRRDGKTRPSEFATGTANGGAYLIVLQRQK
jgi:uncharacterized protein (TIGR03067 family)